jgi:hypothetical protein
MNKDLYNDVVPFPKEMQEHMVSLFNSVKDVDTNTEGYKRNLKLQKATELSYPELKRWKNFFDNFNGSSTDSEFILNGGPRLKGWLNSILDVKRDANRMTKRNKSEFGGLDNQFIKPHTKQGLDVIRPSKSHKTGLEKFESQIMDNLKRINEIMSKL